VYTVNVGKNGKHLPMTYSMLPNKETGTYVKMFRQIAEHLEFEEYPTHFVHDFERAVINAVFVVFVENVKIEGIVNN
jgi:hypothetical protein